MKKTFLIILSCIYLNTNPNNNKRSTQNTPKKTQIQKKATAQSSRLNLNKGKRKKNLKKEIDILKAYLEQELKNSNNNSERQQTLQHAIELLEKNLKH